MSHSTDQNVLKIAKNIDESNAILKIVIFFWQSWNFDVGISVVKKVTQAGNDKLKIDFHVPKLLKFSDTTI